ncbi:MAG TPA: hypothetical protein VD902_20240 [Symbiobacteriaceae bacterium]|nr:hypothetical protein [Symbiobacteriaceae bacterium]
MRRNVMAMTLTLMLTLTLGALVAGCRATERRPQFTGDFQVAALAEAPNDLQAHFERTKALPGLTVLERDGRTYLMLMAGRMEEPGLKVEVLEVKKPQQGSNLAQLTAVLRPGGTGQYPYALLVLEGAEGLDFKARLATRGERVLELIGMPLDAR